MSVENIYSISTASILDKSTIGPAVTWSIGDHVVNAQKTGYCGVELWPQGIIPRIQIAKGELSQEEKNGITSVHQSIVDKNKKLKESVFERVAKSLLLPTKIGSLEYLERIRELVDRDIPVVLFKNVPSDYFERTKFNQTGIQTTPELCEEIGAENAEEFIEAIQEMGFKNIVIDTYHLRRPSLKTGYTNPLADWRKSIPILLPHTQEIHVGLGRSDYGEIPKKTIADELWDFMNNGVNNSEIVQMLRKISFSGWKGLVVLELRPSMIKMLLDQKGVQLTNRNLKITLEGIRETLYQIFDK